ncbi:energy-coupling factor transporter transmembrane protein EcfT, partial [Streptomyces sp. SID9944]|nr:energy-coupling factor transporter transmembrane protein EcfT [Streptomyces sp. SID9944]
DPDALHPGVVPLVAPALPLWPAAAVLLGLAPAFAAPGPTSPGPGSSGNTSPKEPS